MQEGEVGGEQPLDVAGVDLVEGAEVGDDPGQDEHRQVRVVRAVDLAAAQRLDLVSSRCEPHGAVAVQHTVVVDETLREGEVELGLEPCHGQITSSR